MKKPKSICTIVVFIAIILGVILFFSMASTVFLISYKDHRLTF